jgi:hypothetical protein
MKKISKRLLLSSCAAGVLAWASAPAQAQNPQCPTRQQGDSTNACASTAFVQGAVAGGPSGSGAVIIANNPPYNAVCNGSAPASAAIQAAINAGIASGAAVRFHGNCFLNATLTINSAVDFGGTYIGYGLSQAQGHEVFTTGSYLTVAPNINGFTITTPKPVNLQNFAMSPPPATASTGVGIFVTDASYVNQGSIFSNLYITAFADCINFENAGTWTIRDTFITACTTSAVRIRDVFNPDGGDSSMYNVTINGSAGVDSIIQESSGGLKLSGSKINGGRVGLNINLANGANTGILEVVGTSIEGVNIPINLQRQGATGAYQAVQIVGNHLRGDTAGIQVPTDPTAAWLTGVNIAGNSIICAASCINIDSTIGLSIGPNVIWNTGGGTPNPIILQTSVSNAYVATQTLIGNFSAPVYNGTGIKVELRNSITTPTVSGCGAGPVGSVSGTSASGVITIGGGVTGCTLNFAAGTWLNTVHCTLTNHAGTGVIYNSPSLLALPITGGVAAGNLVDYTCNGY